MVYSTLIGDSTYRLNGLALDSDGDIWLAGETQDAHFPLVLPLQSSFPQSQVSLPGASVVTQFDPSGKTLKFSTFLGGNAVGYASNVALDSNHRAHIAGASEYGMYTTTGVYAPTVPAPGPGFSGETFAYLAVIDPTVPAPTLCTSPNNAIYYSDVNAGGSSDQLLTITNCGTLPLTINSISAAAAVFTVPASENKCPQTIAAAQSCTVVVRYSPTSPGTSSNSTLTIETNATIPQTVLSLSGTSTAAPVATFSPTSLTFASQEVGSTSAVQTVTLTNTGTANLTNFIIELTGANTAFSETSTTCNLTLGTGTSCSINVTFTPASAGAVMASLVALDANGVTLSPQPLTISGTGTQTPFTIVAQTGGSTGSTVPAGKSATYALAALPANGYSGTLALNCSNLPTNASCTFTPSTLAVTGGKAAPFTVTISTAASQTSALLCAMGLGSLLTAAIFFLPFGARLRRAAIPAILALLVFASIFSSLGAAVEALAIAAGWVEVAGILEIHRRLPKPT